MINREALQAQLAQKVPQNTIDFNLVRQGLVPESDYRPAEKSDVRGVDLAIAGVLLWLCTNYKSVKELDFQITQHDIDDWLRLRAGLLRKHGVADEMESPGPVITSISDLW